MTVRIADSVTFRRHAYSPEGFPGRAMGPTMDCTGGRAGWQKDGELTLPSGPNRGPFSPTEYVQYSDCDGTDDCCDNLLIELERFNADGTAVPAAAKAFHITLVQLEGWKSIEVAIQEGESYFLHGDSASGKTSNLVPSTSSHLVDGVLTPFIKLTPNVQDKFFEYDGGGATAANSDIAERAEKYERVHQERAQRRLAQAAADSSSAQSAPQAEASGSGSSVLDRRGQLHELLVANGRVPA